MLNETDIGEIRTQYKQAKKPDQQIDILADLYGVSKDEIRTVVGAPITSVVRPKAERCNKKAYFKWDAQLTERLVNLIDQGKTPSQMASELGVPVDKLCWKLKAIGAKYQKDMPAPRTALPALVDRSEAVASDTAPADAQPVGHLFEWVISLENIELSVLESLNALDIVNDTVSRLVFTLEQRTKDAQDVAVRVICNELSSYLSILNLAVNHLYRQKQPLADLVATMSAALRKEKKNAEN